MGVQSESSRHPFEDALPGKFVRTDVYIGIEMFELHMVAVTDAPSARGTRLLMCRHGKNIHLSDPSSAVKFQRTFRVPSQPAPYSAASHPPF